MRTVRLNIRPQYLKSIVDGRKTIEVRVAYPHLTDLSSGDTIIFNGEFLCKALIVNRYASFEEMVSQEDPAKIAPEIGDAATLLPLLRSIYPPEKEGLGVLAVHVSHVEPVGPS